MSIDLVRRIGRDRYTALRERLGFGDDVEARLLRGGLYSRTVLLRAPAGDWVVRIPAEGVAGRLDPGTETRLLAAAAKAGLSPQPLLEAPDGLVVTRYLSEARTLTEADVGDATTIGRIARHLRSLHAVPFDLPEFRAAPVAQSYVSRLDAEALTREQRVWSKECLALTDVFDSRSSVLMLCHNDLVASNLLDDGRLWLIDFEYAVLAEPMLDLANLAAMNAYSAAQCDRLTALYFREETPPFDRTTFSAAVRLLRLIAYFWALGNSATGDADAASGRFVERMAAMLR